MSLEAAGEGQLEEKKINVACLEEQLAEAQQALKSQLEEEQIKVSCFYGRWLKSINQALQSELEEKSKVKGCQEECLQYMEP